MSTGRAPVAKHDPYKAHDLREVVHIDWTPEGPHWRWYCYAGCISDRLPSAQAALDDHGNRHVPEWTGTPRGRETP